MAYLPIGTTTNPATVGLIRGSLDAFERQRVATPVSLFESKLVFDKQPLVWDDQLTTGSGGASTYNTNQCSCSLSVSAATAGKRIRQTFASYNYQAGHSQLILMTGILGTPATGITRKIGQFNDKNGFFFRSNGTTVSVVKRSYTSGTAVDTVVDQANWNIDKLNGTGASGITVDWSKTQIFVVQYQFLGVGSVWYGLDINGNIVLVHRLDHANNLTLAYMSTPNLPLRYSIENDGTGGAAAITQICCSIISEGGTPTAGSTKYLDRDVALTTGNDTNYYPLVAIRLGANYIGTKIVFDRISVVGGTQTFFCYKLFVNPTVTGTALSFTALTNSSIEYDISRTNATTVSGGTAIDGGLGVDSSPPFSIPTDLGSYRLGASIAGVSDIIVLAVQRLTGGAEAFYGGLVFQEYV
jgi:hypothetical protein